jgi:hypothetical protein
MLWTIAVHSLNPGIHKTQSISFEASYGQHGDIILYAARRRPPRSSPGSSHAQTQDHHTGPPGREYPE